MEVGSGPAASPEEARAAEQGSWATKEDRRGGKADRPRQVAKPNAEGEFFKDSEYGSTRERGPGGGKGGKGGRDRKENWKERGISGRDTQQAAAAAGGGKDGCKDRRRREVGGRLPPEAEALASNANCGSENAQAVRGNGAVLLSLLKAHPPGAKPYMKEQLLSIGQLPASRVKPPSLSDVIDKENGASPLLFKGNREKDGEHGEAKRDGESRRERREQRNGGATAGLPAGRSDGGTLDGKEPDRRWSNWNGGGNVEQRLPTGKANDPDTQWDMPDASSNAGTFGGDLSDLANFTLGDIRKAEKSMNGGMSFKDYKASLRAEEVSTGALQGAVAVSSSNAAAAVAATVGDSPFGEEAPGGDADSSFFAEKEVDDACGASRGFGKWFGGRAEAAPATPATSTGTPRSAVIGTCAATATPPLAEVKSPRSAQSMVGPLLPAATGSVTSAAAVAHRSPAGGRPQPQQPESPAAPLGLSSSIEALLAEEPVPPQRKPEPTPATAMPTVSASPVPAGPPAASSPAGAGSNLAGRSILSMLGRTSAPTASSTGTAAATEEGTQQGKLSVAQLFHLAQGKDLPPIPDSSGGAAAANAQSERRAQWEAMRAAQSMWTTAKAQQPSMPSAGRFPYPAGPCGDMPPGDHLLHEAYAQAMMGMGAAAWPAAGKGAVPRTAEAAAAAAAASATAASATAARARITLHQGFHTAPN